MQNKQYSKLLISIIIITLLVTPTSFASAKELQTRPSIKKYTISEDILRFEEKIFLDIPPEYGMDLPKRAFYKVNVYAIDVGDGVVLIDCGDEDYVTSLQRIVRRTFKKPIIAVYLTHGHADHAGGGSYFQEKGIPVYSHSYEVPLIQAGASDPTYPTPDQFTYTGFTPERLYEYFEEEEGFTIEYTPGHTMGSVSIRYDSDYTEYLFTGDTIFELPSKHPKDYSFTLSWYTAYQLYELSNIPGYPNFIGTWQTSISYIEPIASSVHTICPGHGADYPSENANQYLGLTALILGTLPDFPLI